MANPPVLENPLIVLTPLRVADAPEMSAVLADPALYRFTGGQPPSSEELRARYERQVRGTSPAGDETWFNWICRDRSGGVAAGYVQATVRRTATGDEAELAWVIGAPWQGRGFATSATQLILAWLHEQGVGRVAAFIHPSNTPSQRVALRLGLRLTTHESDGEREWARTLTHDVLDEPGVASTSFEAMEGARRTDRGCGCLDRSPPVDLMKKLALRCDDALPHPRHARCTRDDGACDPNEASSATATAARR
jgi:RimJ/RimL family protein N-acetyltransferase